MSAAARTTKTGIPLAKGRTPLSGHGARLNRDPLGFMQELRGYGPFVRIMIGPHPVYVVNDPRPARTVLTAPGLDKGAMNDTLRGPLGAGLVTSEGDFHRRQRRLMRPGFHAERVAGQVAVMAERSAARAAAWTPGAAVDMVGEINRLTLEIVLRTLFAGDPGPRLRAAVKDWLTVKYRSMQLAFSPLEAWAQRVPLLPRWQPPDPGPLERLRAVQQELVEEYRADRRDRGDLLSMLVLAEGPDGSMSDHEIGDELITFFLAATGTTSAALAWAVYETAGRPEVQRLLQEEVDAVLGGRLPTAADLPKLACTRRVIKETLRLHPVVWMQMRRTVSALKLEAPDSAGHGRSTTPEGPRTAGTAGAARKSETGAVRTVELPPGAEIFICQYVLHRDPRFYEAPEEFRPERWAGTQGTEPPRGAYLPFGAGSRVCLGEEYAWAQLVIALAVFVSRWHFTAAAGVPVRALAGTVLRPDHVPVTVEPRSSGTSENTASTNAASIDAASTNPASTNAPSKAPNRSADRAVTQ
jgi:cytochrome P450